MSSVIVEKKKKGRKPGVKKIDNDEIPKKVSSFFKETKKEELTFNIPSMNILSIDKKYDIEKRILQKSFTPNNIDTVIDSISTVDNVALIKSKLIPETFLTLDFKNNKVPLYYNCMKHLKLEKLPLQTNIYCYCVDTILIQFQLVFLLITTLLNIFMSLKNQNQ